MGLIPAVTCLSGWLQHRAAGEILNAAECPILQVNSWTCIRLGGEKRCPEQSYLHTICTIYYVQVHSNYSVNVCRIV